MRSRSALLLILLSLAGCSKHEADPRLALCVSAAQQAAVSPSSVKMVHFNATPEGATQARTVNSSAVMDFDAANSFGASLRGTARCEFAPHPMSDHKGRLLLTKATIGSVELTLQQVADANSLDGSAKSAVDAMIAAEMLKQTKTATEAR